MLSLWYQCPIHILWTNYRRATQLRSRCYGSSTICCYQYSSFMLLICYKYAIPMLSLCHQNAGIISLQCGIHMLWPLRRVLLICCEYAINTLLIYYQLAANSINMLITCYQRAILQLGLRTLWPPGGVLWLLRMCGCILRVRYDWICYVLATAVLWMRYSRRLLRIR